MLGIFKLFTKRSKTSEEINITTNSVDSTTAYESGVVQSESTTSIKRPEQEVTASTKLSVKEASQEMTVTDESLILKNAKENVQVMVSAFHTSQNSKEKLEAAEEVEKDDEVASDSGKSEVPEEKPNISLEKNQLASSLVSAVSNLELLSTINAEVMNQPPEILSERVPNHNLKPTVVASPISFEIPPRAESTPLRDIPESVVGNEVETLREGSSKKQLQKAVPHRKRQKTITLCSQLSQDIENAFKESKNSSQVFNEQAFVEAQERIQALILAKENEWNEKNQKIYEEMDLWQHKAVERGLVIYEYERVMRLLIEALKSSAHKTSQNRSTKVLLGGPGPEKIISPEELALIQKERDQLSEDVISWETSYDELYKRYEKLRQTSLEIKKKDDGIKEAYGKLESRYEMLEQNFQTLRIQAENELERANVEMERLEKVRENDTLGLRLKVKHLETKNNALAASLEAKVKEIADMEALFEDVVRKADRTLIQDSIND